MPLVPGNNSSDDSGNDDDTIEIRTKPGMALARRLVAGGVLAGATVIGTAWLLRRSIKLRIETEMESRIDLDEPCATRLSLYAPDKDVLVIDFHPC